MTNEQLIAEIERLLDELKEQTKPGAITSDTVWIDCQETPDSPRDVCIRFSDGSERRGWASVPGKWFEYDEDGSYYAIVPKNKEVVAWRKLR